MKPKTGDANTTSIRDGTGGGGQGRPARTFELHIGHANRNITKWKKVVGLRVRGGGEGPDPVDHCTLVKL